MINKISRAALFLLTTLIAGRESVAEQSIELKREGNIVHVTIDNKLFTRYHAAPDQDPILWPVIGPTGVEMTRAYPLREGNPDEKTDHPHHRSIWFSHGDVAGVDFWTDPGENNRKKRGFGKIVHREFIRVDESGTAPTIVTRNDWINSKNETLLTDVRTVSFGSSPEARWIDFDIQLFSVADDPVKIGDTKEGSFGIRVAGWMKADAGGKIINSRGETDKEAWGVEASWVDFHGDHDGQTLGIAMLNHPSSFRFPTHWHVRTYGLFAANVFGLHNFKNSDDEDGSHELAPGESLMFCYRVFMHTGDEQKGRVPEAFIEYAKVDKTKLTLEELQANSQVEVETTSESALETSDTVAAP